MQELTKAQKARIAIRVFKTTVDAFALRGYYRPSGKSGESLSEALKMLSPEIYGTMNDKRIIELKGLEYVIDRLPCGIEECSRITLTAQEEFVDTSFEKIQPPKRRRISYRVSEKEMCFVITSGLSELYDIITHLTFLHIEAKKIRSQMSDELGNITSEWKELEKTIHLCDQLTGSELDQAIWNLSIILGRTYLETRATYDYFELNRKQNHSNRGLFKLIFTLGTRMKEEEESRDHMLLIYLTPSLKDMIGHHKYSLVWANSIKEKLISLGLQDRPIHIISANMHSVMNWLYGYAALNQKISKNQNDDFYHHVLTIREYQEDVKKFAKQYGLIEMTDHSGMYIDYQIIDTTYLNLSELPHQLSVNESIVSDQKPVILVIDYAFGTQAFDALDRLLEPFSTKDKEVPMNVQSISVMGKAGILPGKKGDIMLATAHVLEGTSHNYIVDNDLKQSDFDSSVDVYEGPIVTVLGTSLQNRDVLNKFQSTSWKAIGLEMEGGHYQKAISAAIIKGHISNTIKVRYAYYASDNPLVSGQTLSSGSMGKEGIKPTYLITKIILEKIFS